MDQPHKVREWLTSKEAAEAINVSRSFMRKLIQVGRLKAANIGTGVERREWRIRRVDLDSFMAAAMERR